MQPSRSQRLFLQSRFVRRLCKHRSRANFVSHFARSVLECSDTNTLSLIKIRELHQYAISSCLSKWLVETVMTHPHLQGLRRWILLTADAHGLYRQFGWTEISDPGKWMQIHDKTVYQK